MILVRYGPNSLVFCSGNAIIYFLNVVGLILLSLLIRQKKPGWQIDSRSIISLNSSLVWTLSVIYWGRKAEDNTILFLRSSIMIFFMKVGQRHLSEGSLYQRLLDDVSRVIVLFTRSFFTPGLLAKKFCSALSEHSRLGSSLGRAIAFTRGNWRQVAAVKGDEHDKGGEISAA